MANAQQSWIEPVELEKTIPVVTQPTPSPVTLSLREQATSLCLKAKRHYPFEIKDNIDAQTTPEDANSQDAATASSEKPLPKKADATKKNLAFRLMLASATILMISLIIQDASLFLAQQWKEHVLLGLFFSGIILTLSGSIVVLMSREVSRFRQLRSLSALRQETNRIIQTQTFGQGYPLVNRIAQLYQARKEISPHLQKFHNKVDDHLEDKEVLALFSTQILTKVDSQAYQVVVRHASTAALMTAISPIAWLDAILFLWRNVWMVREIAEVYGARPGASGSLVLIRQAVRGMMGAGITDILASNASSSLGDSVASVIMAKAGQGVANGLFIARIGLQTMDYCRPLPFSAEEKPGLGRIRKELQQAIKKSGNHAK